MELLAVTGKSENHVVPFEDDVQIHREVIEPFKEMQEAARAEGFELTIVSGFRSFGYQMRIWNEKASGKRRLLDSNGKELDRSKMSPEEIVYAILRWSALPGASRHHWGTDMDICDRNTLTPDYTIQLVASEYNKDGIFSGISEWLDKNAGEYEFFRPYHNDHGGIAPERWHLSYAPISEMMEAKLTLARLKDAIESSEMVLKEVVLEKLPEIFSKYVRNIDFFEE